MKKRAELCAWLASFAGNPEGRLLVFAVWHSLQALLHFQDKVLDRIRGARTLDLCFRRPKFREP
jgi:hypothetical protein